MTELLQTRSCSICQPKGLKHTIVSTAGTRQRKPAKRCSRQQGLLRKIFPGGPPTKTCDIHQFLNICEELCAGPFCPPNVNRVLMKRPYSISQYPASLSETKRWHYPDDLSLMFGQFPCNPCTASRRICIPRISESTLQQEQTTHENGTSSHTETQWEPPMITNIN